MEYYSAIKKNEIMPFVGTWMDLEIIILSEVNHREEETLYDIPLYVKSKKKWYEWTYLQNRRKLTDLTSLSWGKDGGKGELGSVESTRTHCYI